MGELRLNVGGLVDPSWTETKKEKEGYRNDMPEKEMDEVALRAPERRKRGWMAKEAAKDTDKGWWFMTRQVKIFTLLDQNLFERKNASR